MKKCYFDDSIGIVVHRFPVKLDAKNGGIERICVCYCGDHIVDRTNVKIKFGLIPLVREKQAGKIK